MAFASPHWRPRGWSSSRTPCSFFFLRADMRVEEGEDHQFLTEVLQMAVQHHPGTSGNFLVELFIYPEMDLWRQRSLASVLKALGGFYPCFQVNEGTEQSDMSQSMFFISCKVKLLMEHPDLDGIQHPCHQLGMMNSTERC